MPNIPTVYIQGDCQLVQQAFMLYYLGQVALLLVVGYLLLRLGRLAARMVRSVRSHMQQRRSYVQVEVIPPGAWRPPDPLDTLSRQYLMKRMRQFMAREED